MPPRRLSATGQQRSPIMNDMMLSRVAALIEAATRHDGVSGQASLYHRNIGERMWRTKSLSLMPASSASPIPAPLPMPPPARWATKHQSFIIAFKIRRLSCAAG